MMPFSSSLCLAGACAFADPVLLVMGCWLGGPGQSVVSAVAVGGWLGGPGQAVVSAVACIKGLVLL